MEIRILFWFTIVCAVLLLAAHKKVRDWLDNKNIVHLDFQGYFRIIGVTVIAMILVVAFNVGGSNEKINSDYYKVKSAFNVAKEEVKKKLKAPSTAVFANEYDEESKYKINEDGSVVIHSYVDAENSFGAHIRTHYQCTVTQLGDVEGLITW